MGVQIEMIFEMQCLSGAEIWELATASSYLQITPPVRKDGVRVGKSKLKNAVSAENGFFLEWDGGSSMYAHVGKGDHSLFKVNNVIGETLNAIVSFAAPFIDTNRLIQGRAYQHQYDYWQNADALWEYETAGRTVEGVATTDNGLPSPLNEVIVDTSQNPGRRVIKNGYVEMVSHLMWFGEQFWSRTGQARTIPDFAVDAWQHQLCDFVQFRNVPFTEDDPAAELQDSIREFFYASME